MSALDLHAVCERHGISVVELCGGFYAAQGETIGEWTAYTPADAVCALLKARYRIGTGSPCAARSSSRTPPPWLAAKWEKGKPETVVSAFGPTELAAVVALADRLAGVRE
jgi:hypothetical protein